MIAIPLRMFRLAPGQSIRFCVRPVGGADRPDLALVASRPDEGRSTELELELYDSRGGLVDIGRVPIDQGYMAVLRLIRSQLHSVSKWREDKEFDLLLAEQGGTAQAASS